MIPPQTTGKKGKHISTKRGFACLCKNVPTRRSVANTSTRAIAKPYEDRD
jgi:hypothetical protein